MPTNYTPLADRIRPKSLDTVVGQEHLLGEGKVLKNIIKGGKIPNMIFYGPSGTGKTTVANLIAAQTNRTLYKLNATTASTSDIKEIIAAADTLLAQNGVLLYLDEIQYFNKKQQQTLLEFLESGKITMIASTTENPYFYIYNAILSRATIFEFKPVLPQQVQKALQNALSILSSEGIGLCMEDGILEKLANASGGDVRKALNALEALMLSCPTDSDGVCHVTHEMASLVAQRSSMRYDRDGDTHYDLLSALHKSIRGSDPDAAIYYLARVIEGGDLISPCRRILAAASEDIGLAYPMAAVIVKSCVDSAMQLGLPEARLPLTQAVLVLATAPKSNSVVLGIDQAMADIQSGSLFDVPDYLKDGHYSGAKKMGRAIGYQYPHDFAHHYVKQTYLPEQLKDKQYYKPQMNKNEQALKNYWKSIKGESADE